MPKRWMFSALAILALGGFPACVGPVAGDPLDLSPPPSRVRSATPAVGAPSLRKKSAAQSPSNNAVRAARATPVHRVVLPNGMRILLAEAPEEDITAAVLLVQTGALEEKGPVAGITRVLVNILDKRITDTLDGEDRIEAVGAHLRCQQELDYSRISLESRSADFEPLLNEVAGALERPLALSELDAARKKVLESFKEPQGALGQLYDIFRQSFYRYHPYRSSQRGSELAIERLDVKAVQEYLDNFFVPNRMILGVAGRFEPISTETAIRKSFGKLKAHQMKEVEVGWEPKSVEKEVYLSGGNDMGWLFVGYPAPSVGSHDYATMRIISSLLGEGLSSRLFTEIREKRSLAYELGSMYPVLRGPSHFLTYTITKPEQVYRAKQQLLREIERLKKEGVGQVELDESRRKVIGNYLLERETNSGKAFHLALSESAGVGHEFEQAFLKELETVTPAEILVVAKRYLDNCTLIVARPPGRFYWDL